MRTTWRASTERVRPSVIARCARTPWDILSGGSAAGTLVEVGKPMVRRTLHARLPNQDTWI